ncbi:MAG TPA: TIGR03067 domain-containing protein [Gemmataceae bacterium]|nr:TIGR03067 domain-containing protein [Gemmataceae bacterium]
MRLRALFVLLAAGLLVAADKVKDEGTKKKDDLTGKWTIVTFERGGEKDENSVGNPVTFGDGKVVVKGQNGSHGGTYQVHADKTPKQMDFTPSSGDQAGQVHKGIYEVKGDTLKILLVPPDEERPKDFKSKGDSGRMYVELKRQKD